METVWIDSLEKSPCLQRFDGRKGPHLARVCDNVRTVDEKTEDLVDDQYVFHLSPGSVAAVTRKGTLKAKKRAKKSVLKVIQKMGLELDACHRRQVEIQSGALHGQARHTESDRHRPKIQNPRPQIPVTASSASGIKLQKLYSIPVTGSCKTSKVGLVNKKTPLMNSHFVPPTLKRAQKVVAIEPDSPPMSPLEE